MQFPRAPVLAMLALAGCAEAHGATLELDDCSARAVAEAIEAARPGDTIYIGSCTLTDVSIVLGPGVGLAGDGPGLATISVSEGRTAIVMEGGGERCATIRGVTILSDGEVAIAVRGGNVCIEDVEIDATLGVGILAEDTTHLAIRRVRVSGPVTADNADEEPLEPTPMNAFHAGMAIRCAPDVVLEDIELSGWSQYGLVLESSRFRWDRGLLHDGLGVGALLWRSEGTAAGLEVYRTFQGMRLIPAYGLVASESHLETQELVVEESAAYGVFLHGGDSQILGGRVSRNANVGIWAQQGDVVVRELTMEDNGTASLLGFQSSGLVVEDALLARSRIMTRIVGVMPIDVGVGLVAIGMVGPLSVRRVRFEENPMYAGVIALAAPPTGLFAIEDVTVTPSDRPLVVEGGPPPEGWERGVSPEGAAATLASGTTGLWPLVGEGERIPPYDPVCP